MAPSTRTRIGVGVTVLVAVVAAAGLSFSPLIRARLAAEARRRDVEVNIARVRPGWFAVVLDGVTVRLPGVEGVTLDVSQLKLELGALLALKEVKLRGGQLSLSGDVDTLKAQLLEWRSRRPMAQEGPRSVLPVQVEQLAVRWDGGGGAWASGVLSDLERDDTGVRATFDKLDAHFGAMTLASAGGSGSLGPSNALKSVTLGRVEVTYAAPAPSPRDGASVNTSTTDYAPPPLPVSAGARGRKKTARRAPADDNASAVSVADASTPLVPLPDLHRMRATITRLAQSLNERLPIGAAVVVDGLELHLDRSGEERLSLGPGPFRIERQGESIDLTFSTGASTTGTPLSLHALLPSDESDIEVSLAGGPVPLSLLGLRAKVLTDIDRATLGGRARVVLDGKAKNLTFDGQLKFRGLTLQDPRLSAEPLRGVDFEATARGVMSDHGELRLDDAEAAIGALRIDAHGGFEQTADHVSVALDFEVPRDSCEAAIGSIPTALLPTLQGAHMRGTLGLKGRLAFDTRKPDDLSLDYSVEDHCRLTDAPPEIDRERFTKPFAHRIYTPDGKLSEEMTGPTTDNWTDLEHISPFMQAAVLTTEDGAFYRHHGFDHAAIRGAVAADIKARHFIRGASTITMQLAKNLFLSREKTLSRKLEELILTDYIDQAFTKEETMELYLNIIEFGPNVYGVTAAADHYFGRKPEELNLAECMFLSSILPQPIRYHHLYEHGELSESWIKGIRARMAIAQRTGKITAAELAEGLTEPVVFHLPDTPRPAPRPPVVAPRSEEDESDWKALN
jgi:hypothetical protein